MPSLLRTSIAVSLCFLAVACGGSAPPPQPAGGGKAVDAATAGSLSGKVVFEGTPPPREPLRTGSDVVCNPNGPQLSQSVLIGDGGAIQNVFVYVKDGLDPSYSFPVPVTPAVINQKGCQYEPRVLGVRTGQPFDVVNNDATLHNVHALPLSNTEFNVSEPTLGQHVVQTFTVPEIMVRFQCNVHGWMAAYLGVVSNPFFAVTGADGSFELKGLPPGTYTIEAWHEKFGTRTAKVTIGDHQAQTASFTFSAATSNH